MTPVEVIAYFDQDARCWRVWILDVDGGAAVRIQVVHGGTSLGAGTGLLDTDLNHTAQEADVWSAVRFPDDIPAPALFTCVHRSRGAYAWRAYEAPPRPLPEPDDE